MDKLDIVLKIFETSADKLSLNIYVKNNIDMMKMATYILNFYEDKVISFRSTINGFTTILEYNDCYIRICTDKTILKGTKPTFSLYDNTITDIDYLQRIFAYSIWGFKQEFFFN